jgi:hypothetical protein
MFPSVIPKAQCKSTIDRHRAKVHQNCKIDTARFKEGKRRRDSRPGEGLRDTRHSASCWIKMGRSSHMVARRSRRQRSRTVAKNLKASVRLSLSGKKDLSTPRIIARTDDCFYSGTPAPPEARAPAKALRQPCQNVSVILLSRGGRSGSNPQSRAVRSIIR